MDSLPNKELLRINEVASYFSVSERTVRLWIKHGYLEGRKIAGTVRVPRESLNKKCILVGTKEDKVLD